MFKILLSDSFIQLLAKTLMLPHMCIQTFITLKHIQPYNFIIFIDYYFYK